MTNMSRGMAALCIVVALGSAAGCERERRERHEPDASTRRTTASGAVLGFKGQYGSDAWLGIPFARPPVGDLRWRAPEPPSPWPGTREALVSGDPCPQYSSVFGGVATGRADEPVGNEDCLYLNVWAPRGATGGRRPVMLWIHGGGNSIGQAANYDGGRLAATHDVVVVAPNYRLGPFGWFRLAALRAGDPSPAGQSGNFGTLDLVRALQWVRDNAAAFGGDPDNVTIFGESAGGLNTFTLLLSSQATGLFHRAIVESGGTWMSPIAEAENFTDDAEPGAGNSSGEAALRMLQEDGLAGGRAAARARLQAMTDAEIAAYLRGRSTTAILEAYKPMPGIGMIDMPKVFPDGVVLPAEPALDRFAQRGGYNEVPVMLGTNRDENKLFMFADPFWVKRVLWILPRLRDPRMYDLTAKYLSLMWKATGADEPAATMAAAQGRSAFVYRFDWDEEPTYLGADLSEMLGAAHGLEIPFVFGHWDLGPAASMLFTDNNEAGRLLLSSQMMSYWTQFARTGDPGQGRDGSLPLWTSWDLTVGAPKFMVLDTPAGGGLRMSDSPVTRDLVLAQVAADPALSVPRDRCMVLRSLAKFSRGYSQSEYAAEPACTAYPYADYPWQG